MANAEHLELLRQGVDVWNKWRMEQPLVVPDLREASLNEASLSGVKLQRADLSGASLAGASLDGANLDEADLGGSDLIAADLNDASLVGASLDGAYLCGAYLNRANLKGANLNRADLDGADLGGADLSGADLHEARLFRAHLDKASLSGANARGAYLRGASLIEASLVGVDLLGADLSEANLNRADLEGADLSGATLARTLFVNTNLVDAVLTGCRIHGISAWDLKLSEGTKQQDLVITPPDEPKVAVDNIEVAQFVYLLLDNEKIRDVIDTVGKKGVLLLGRFTEGRIVVLDRLRDELRKRGYLPIVFNFDKPETKDFTETVRILAGLSKFVIADLSGPKSAPYELGAIVSQTMIPFQPIIAADETPFAMLQDLWINYPDRVFRPIHYSSFDALIASLDEKIIRPAEARFVELLARKAETMRGEHI